jgi:hypothetical protein
LTWDVTNKHSLFQYYGGGSEIVTLINGDFAKLDKLMYVLWAAFLIAPDKINLVDPIRVMYYTYRQSHLFLHSLGFDPSADKAHRLIDNSRYLIDPIYTATPLNAITEFEREIFYKPDHFVHVVQVIDTSKQCVIGQFHLCRTKVENPDVAIRFQPSNKLNLKTSQALVESILRRVHEIVRGNSELRK